jgi:P-type conjugative transfer protein TrbJ
MRRFQLIGAVLALALVAPGLARAQFTVTDIIADAQTTETAIQSAAGVAKQVQQYEMQVQQYQNMVQNTVSPVTNIYRQVTGDINGAQSALDGVTRLVPVGQSVTQYLSQFTSGGGITSSTDFCATQGLCTPTQFAAAQAAQAAASQARDAALVSGGQTQLASLQSQATDLQIIGQAAQGATGQMQALGYNNQIAAVGAGANLQVASLLTQRMQQEAADRLAAQQAAAQRAAASKTATQGVVDNLTTFYGPAPTGTYGQMAAGLPTLSQ